MKIILLVTLFFIPVFFGFHLSINSEKRFKNIRYFSNCLEKIHIKITQYLIPLEDIFFELSNEEIEPFNYIFININKRIINGGETFKDIFLCEFSNAQALLGFAEEEMNLIKSTAELLGSSNVEGQEKYLIGLTKLSEKILKLREEEYKTTSSAYKKLGIMAGLFLVIIFI